jgi:hypothetical protein
VKTIDAKGKATEINRLWNVIVWEGPVENHNRYAEVKNVPANSVTDAGDYAVRLATRAKTVVHRGQQIYLANGKVYETGISKGD